MRLLANDGTAIGAVCVFDDKPRPLGISKLERKALLVLAGQVQSLLELRRSLIEREKEVAFKKTLTLKLRHVADHDPLTGLPHRGPFQAHLNKMSCPANDCTDRIALILVDIDHFKQVNDALGHDVGDKVLRSLARRLREVVREGDIVARLGGDEFGILMYGVKSEQVLSDIVSSFNTRLQHSVKCNGRDVECHVSVGIATYPDQAKTAEELVKHSDLALAAAKSVRSCAVHFDPSMALEFEQETAMLSFARTGLAEERIVPYYQPKIDLRTNRVIGFEALVRYVHNAETILLPEVFSHAFNDLKLARALGTEMLTRVLNDIAAWSSEGSMDFSVAINTCAADFNGDDFAERLIAELTARKLKPHQIEIEVTEGVFLGRGADHVSRALRCLHNFGVRIALDDFGTGYGCLTHLKQFPIDIIKIDRSFVAGIAKDPDDTSIVKALIGLGQSLGIQTIAEGIETTEQKDFVRRHGCDIAQGFLFGRAIQADRVLAKANSIRAASAC
jgi:diguanylate cyclase (GGDEF)-like protein